MRSREKEKREKATLRKNEVLLEKQREREKGKIEKKNQFSSGDVQIIFTLVKAIYRLSAYTKGKL